MENIRIQTYLSPEIAEKLRRMATADGISVSTLAASLIAKSISLAPAPQTNAPANGADELTKTVMPVNRRLMYLRFLLEELTKISDPSGAVLSRAQERFTAEKARQLAKKEVANG